MMFGTKKNDEKKENEFDFQTELVRLLSTLVEMQKTILNLSSTSSLLYNRIYTLETLVAQLTLKISDLELRNPPGETPLN
jgi:hypothetical protein